MAIKRTNSNGLEFGMQCIQLFGARYERGIEMGNSLNMSNCENVVLLFHFIVFLCNERYAIELSALKKCDAIIDFSFFLLRSNR